MTPTGTPPATGHRQAAEALPEDREKTLRLAILLRLSCVMNRSRSYTMPPEIKVTADTNSLSLKFTGTWLDDHPLTRADLQTEAEYLEAVNFQLTFN